MKLHDRSMIRAARIGDMAPVYEPDDDEAPAGSPLARFRIEERCAGCPWPDVCAQDVTCWDLERSADRSDVTGDPILEFRAPAHSLMQEVNEATDGDVPADEPVDPSADAASEHFVHGNGDSGVHAHVNEPASIAAAEAAGPTPGRGSPYWSRERVLERIREWAELHGRPPKQYEARNGSGLPSPATVHAYCGSWAQAIEDAGFDRPIRGGGHRPRAPRGPDGRERGRAPRWLRVPGTGLAYQSVEEAYVAAEEIEEDGERAARKARVEGNEAKADRAIDQSRALANAVRYAASLADPDTESPFAPTPDDPAQEPATAPRVDVDDSPLVTAARKVDEARERARMANGELDEAIAHLEQLIREAATP